MAVGGFANVAEPSARKVASEGPPGVMAFQTPTIGWPAIASDAASWAAAGRADAATARPIPPAPRPARAVRRETGLVVRRIMVSTPLLRSSRRLLGRRCRCLGRFGADAPFSPREALSVVPSALAVGLGPIVLPISSSPGPPGRMHTLPAAERAPMPW